MTARLFSAALRGVEAREAQVEVNAHGAGKPIIVLVGVPAAAGGCRVSRQAVMAASRRQS